MVGGCRALMEIARVVDWFCRFHTVTRGLGALAGNFDGKGGHSALGNRYFDDESFLGKYVQEIMFGACGEPVVPAYCRIPNICLFAGWLTAGTPKQVLLPWQTLARTRTRQCFVSPWTRCLSLVRVWCALGLYCWIL